ncbi:MAG: rod shape-determining protein MreC [Sulfuricella sp.]|nr:rod shape-determining protein MreC [Sulfuricella sp.]
MEHDPPPFFKTGPSPQARFAFFAMLSIVLMVGDVYQSYLGVLRQGVAVVVTPLQRLANLPSTLAGRVGDFFISQSQLQRENARLQQEDLQHSAQLQGYQAAQAENAYLRKLLDARQQSAQTLVMAEILYAGRDPFSQKIIVDKGTTQGIAPGQPVVDNIGVIGQVTRAYPFSSEITLLTDKDQAIPIEIVRNGMRAVAFGQGQDGTLGLAFMPMNADVQPGDAIVTSGIDGVYPAGLPVATVSKIERNAAVAFARIVCTPSAGVGQHKQVLIVTSNRIKEIEVQAAPLLVPPAKDSAPKGKFRRGNRASH